MDFLGLCIKDNKCLCLPGFKTDQCATRIAKFQGVLNVLGTPLSYLDVYLIWNIVIMAVDIGLNILYIITAKPAPSFTNNCISITLNHFKSPNLLHFAYSVFIYSKCVPSLYSIIGSRNFVKFIGVCHAVRLTYQLFCRRQNTSALSLINLTALLLLQQLKSGHINAVSTDLVSECVRFVSIDILTTLDFGSIWIVLQSAISISILLSYIL